MAFSNQHPEVCRGLLACKEHHQPTHTHPRKLSRIGLNTHCNLVTTWCSFFALAPAQSTIVLLLEGPFFPAPCVSTRQSLDRPYFYF